MTSAGQTRFHGVNPRNKNIGRRTGRDTTAGKNIRIDEDGFENFDDYLSESEADVTEECTKRQASCIREESHFTSSQGSTTCTSASSKDDCRQNTSICQAVVSQSVPNASAYSNAYNSISTSQSALSQLNLMTSAGQTRFHGVNPRNKNIGRRTGRDMTAGKNIRIDKDGFENFDDYLSESESDVTEECTKRQVSFIREESHFTSSQGSTTCTSASSEDDCRQNTSISQAGVSQSVPNASAYSNAYNSISTSQPTLSRLYSGGPTNRSKFEWLRNKNIGRRTGKDMTANKQIRVDEDGFENFDDYMSESDSSTVSSRMSISIRKPGSQKTSISKLASGDQSTRFSSLRNSIETTVTSLASTETKSTAHTEKMSSEEFDREEHLEETVQDHNTEESTNKADNKQKYTDSLSKSLTSEEEECHSTHVSGHRSDYIDTPLSSCRSSSACHVAGTVSHREIGLDVNTQDSSKTSGLRSNSLLSSLRQNLSIRTDLSDRSRSQKESSLNSETSHLSKSKVYEFTSTSLLSEKMSSKEFDREEHLDETVQDHNTEESTNKADNKQKYTDSPSKSLTSEEEECHSTHVSGHGSDYIDTPLSSRRSSSASHVAGTMSKRKMGLDVNTQDSSKTSGLRSNSLSSSLRQNLCIRTDLSDRSRSQKGSTLNSETSHLSKSKLDRSNAEQDIDEKNDSDQDLEQSSDVTSDGEHDSLSDRDDKSNINYKSNIKKMVSEKQADSKVFRGMKSAKENITEMKMTTQVSDGEEKQSLDENFSDSGNGNAENTNHYENDEMAHSVDIDNEEKESSEMNENAEEDDSGELRPSQAPTQIDVAGNKSGSITKLEVPASVVSFDKTRKRLSYSAVELSDKTRQSNRSRINTANEELRSNTSKTVTKAEHSGHFTILDNKSRSKILDNNNSQKQFSVVGKSKMKSKNTDGESLVQKWNVYSDEESEFLCLAGRSMHPAESQGNDNISDDKDDIMIFDDYPNKNKSLGAKQKLKNQNKKANDVKSYTVTGRDNDSENKTEVKAKKPVRNKGQRKTTHEVNTISNKVNKNSKKKIVDEVNEMDNSKNVNDNVIDTEIDVDLNTDKGKDNSNFSEQENTELKKTNIDNATNTKFSGKSSAKAKSTSNVKGKRLAENNTREQSKNSKGQNKQKQKKERNDDTGSHLNKKMSEHISSDNNSDQQQLIEKPHRNIQNLLDDDHEGDIVIGSVKEKFNESTDDTTKAVSVNKKNSNTKKELKRKSVSDESEDSNKENDSHSSRKISKESTFKKAMTKEGMRNSKSLSPDMHRKRKSSLDAEQKLADLNGNATPEAGGRLSVPGAFGSGVSFRVSRRSELLQDVGSGYLGEVTVRKEPVAGLTPCLSRAGAKKRKGRRVTICSEMNTELELTEKHSESGSPIKQLRFSTESRASTSSLPSADSTPMHIFETTHSATPKAGSVELSVIKDRLIKPSPPMEGLRRSQRTRLAPIAHYKNEQIVYDYSSISGPVIIGVQPSLEVKWNKIVEERRKKRKLKSEIRKAVRLNKSANTPRRKLSMHRSLPVDLEKMHDKSVQEITVYNQALDTEDGIDCIAKHESLKALGPDHNSPKKEDPYLITPIFNHPCVSAGNLTIRGNAEKPEHLVTADYTLFRIEYGKVLVRIHKTSAVLESGDTFLVPIGNSYSIMNLRSDDAKLFYTIHQQAEGSVLTPKNS